MSSFDFLADSWFDLAKLGELAEQYLYSDTNTCFIKMGMMAEHIVEYMLAYDGIAEPEYDNTHANRIKLLKRNDLLPREIDNILYVLRKTRNDAAHAGEESLERAKTNLALTYDMASWFMQTYGDYTYEPQKYELPSDVTADMAELERKNKEQEKYISNLKEQLTILQQKSSASLERKEKAKINATKYPLSEHDTRMIIDKQLREVGWEADTDNLHYEKFQDGTVKCIEDEIPFEVPEGWEWCRLNTIAIEIFAGGDKPNDTIKEYDPQHTIPVYSNGIELNGLYGYTTSPRVTLPAITISARGTIGFTCVRKEPFVPIIRLITIIPYKELNIDYLSMVFMGLVVQSEGSSIPQLTVPGIKPKLIPVPPVDTQKSITEKTQNILETIISVNLNKEKLLNAIKDIKSKILDLAIHGKLVPQDPNDEPASVLLERIRAEKEKLIKQGKIKRDKKESIIFKGDDNSYYERVGNSTLELTNEEIFDLPNGWEYVRLKNITIKLVDGSHNPPKGETYQTEYIMASSRNINNNTIVDLKNVRYVSKEQFEKENKRTNVSENDILLTTVATLGRSCIYQKIPPNLCLQRSVTVITPLIITPQYLKLFFDSPYFQKLISKEATGTAQKGFYLSQLENVLVPIPPFNEQYAVTSYANKLLVQLNDIMNVVRE